MCANIEACSQLLDSIPAPTNIGRVPDKTFKGNSGNWWVRQRSTLFTQRDVKNLGDPSKRSQIYIPNEKSRICGIMILWDQKSTINSWALQAMRLFGFIFFDIGFHFWTFFSIFRIFWISNLMRFYLEFFSCVWIFSVGWEQKS